MPNTLDLIRSVYPDAVSLSPGQIAKILGIHVRSVNRALADGTLRVRSFTASALSSHRRVLVSDLAAYLDTAAAPSGKKRKRGRPVGSRNRTQGATS